MASRVLELLAHFSAGLPDPLPADPMPLLETWFKDAARAPRSPNPDAIVVATCSSDADPSARVVLCRGLDVAQGSVTFYSNARSRKGRDIGANPRAEAVFFWDHTSRQARVHGPVVTVSDVESDAYFGSRPLLSRLGAWASQQSEPIESRAVLAERLLETMDRFGVSLTDLALSGRTVHVPRPPHWGGFRIVADRVELWTLGAGRLHDRAQWTRTVTAVEDGVQSAPWRATRVSP